LPAWKIPGVWESGALLRFCGLHLAVASFEENTFAVRLFEKRKAVPILTQPRVTPDEIAVRNSKKSGHRGDVIIVDFHKTRPPAAMGAALASVINFLFQKNENSSPANRGITPCKM